MNTDKMREQFEAWAIADGYRNFSKSDDGSYIGNVDYSWKAWQAAIESQSAELAQARARVVELEAALKICVADLQKWAKYSPDCTPTVRMVEKALASTDTAAQKWIPVSERLPETPIKLGELKLPNGEVFKPQENSYEVLVWRKGGSADITKLIRAHNGTTCWYMFDAEVTHWQPLPEPPKEKP